MSENKAIKSMTAFGGYKCNSEFGLFNIEIQSLNRRFLEIHVSLPPALSSIESAVRSWIKEYIGRGMVTVTVTWSWEKQNVATIVPNLLLAKEIKNAWEKISQELEIPFEKEFSLKFLVKQEGILQYQFPQINKEAIENCLNQGIHKALTALLDMKIYEGNLLRKDIEEHIDRIETSLIHIQEKAQNITTAYRLKIKRRLTDLLGESTELDDRIEREIALLAERADYTEESVRFQSHIMQLRHFLSAPLKSSNETRGKVIEFLLQELSRELNTIGTKANDAAVSRCVVESKGEIEKIREQIQNIE